MTDIYNWQEAIDIYYPAHRKVRGILLRHSSSVAALAMTLAERGNLGLDPAEIEAAAMLHDIGIIRTDAQGIDCHGIEPYLCHGPVGADMLRAAGAPEQYALVAERHTGAGLTAAEIVAAGLPLPPGRDYMPRSPLEQLICYADCFYSKGGDYKRKDIGRVRASMARFGPGVLRRFDDLALLFGLP